MVARRTRSSAAKDPNAVETALVEVVATNGVDPPFPGQPVSKRAERRGAKHHKKTSTKKALAALLGPGVGGAKSMRKARKHYESKMKQRAVKGVHEEMKINLAEKLGADTFNARQTSVAVKKLLSGAKQAETEARGENFFKTGKFAMTAKEGAFGFLKKKTPSKKKPSGGKQMVPKKSKAKKASKPSGRQAIKSSAQVKHLAEEFLAHERSKKKSSKKSEPKQMKKKQPAAKKKTAPKKKSGGLRNPFAGCKYIKMMTGK